MHLELVVAKLITVLLGFIVAATAYRSYRRYRNEPMLFLAIGFAIITLGSVIEGILFDVLQFSIYWAGTVQTTVVAIGMLVVLYSLYGPARYTPGQLRRRGDSGNGDRE